MSYRHNVGRFIVVLAFGKPRVWIVLERAPKRAAGDRVPSSSPASVPLHSQEYVHHFLLRSAESFPSSRTDADVVERVARQLTCGDLADDSSFLVDVTEAGAPHLRLVRDQSLAATPVHAGGEVAGRDELGVHSVPVRDLVSGVRLTLQEKRLGIAATLPGADSILAGLDGLEERLPSTTARAIAFGTWWGRKTGFGEHVSRRPLRLTPEERQRRAWAKRDAEELAEAEEGPRRPAHWITEMLRRAGGVRR
jgi:hypothetical protein